MPAYVAFLRGINVGGHRVKMDRLREVFEELGLAGVTTVLASGNVIFTSNEADTAALQAAIEKALEDGLGYGVDTFLRTPSELSSIAALASTENGDDSRSHYVIFLHAGAPESLKAALRDLNSEVDDFQFAGREVHWHIRGKLSASPLFGDSRLDRATKGQATTMRNMNTVRRLVSRMTSQ